LSVTLGNAPIADWHRKGYSRAVHRFRRRLCRGLPQGQQPPCHGGARAAQGVWAGQMECRVL